MGVGAGVSGEFQGMQGLIMASAGGISDSLQGELQGALTQMNQSFEAAAQMIQSVMAPGMEILVQVVITVVKGITALVNLFIKLPKPVKFYCCHYGHFSRHWAHVDYGNDGSAKISTV